MTPMIDIVFQLIIFFMLVMDMSQVQTEKLELPSASTAIRDTRVDKHVLILNILKDGTVKVNGKRVGDAAMEGIFQTRRNMEKYRGPDGTVTYPLLIRADRSAEFEHLQRITMIAAQYGGVIRLQLGAKMERGNR